MTWQTLVLINASILLVILPVKLWFRRLGVGFLGLYMILSPAAFNLVSPVEPWIVAVGSAVGVLVLAVDIRYMTRDKTTPDG